MEEPAYRTVALCRVLGSTTRYRIVRLLAQQKMRPSDLRRELRKAPNVISVHLARLRSAGLVRFKREPDGLFYWLKLPELPQLLDQIESFASSLR